jgi:serine/threonine-protein kinase
MEYEERLKAALADRYLIEREIGSGGMATVYLAEDLKHHRQVAVKVLDPDLAESLGAERFLREIETAANLTHPHILPLFDSGEADGFLFYVMPFVEGESLRSRLTKENQLPVEDAIQITREIADALAYAHEKGVIHRDVKPANIMLEEGHAVLADFGVAHAVAEAKDERLTRTGTSLGTPAYMSPEQATGEQDLDGRSDQYALGCVLYEMLAGHPPFVGAQVEAVIRQHLTEQPPSVTQARPSVADEVAKVINRALAKSPADRYRTAGEMAAALALTTAPGQVERKEGTKALRIALGVAVLAVIALVGTMVFRPDRGTTPDPVATAEDERPGVAVLPFDNLSPNPEDAYFADGMQEEITSKLSEISALRIPSRNSTMQYREERKPTRQIAEELGVGFMVEGSARLAGNQVRLTVQLIDARRDEHLWANDYTLDLSAENLFEVEGEIARQVAAEIGFNLTPNERDRVGAVLTSNTDAYLLYLQGNEAFIDERQRGAGSANYPSVEYYDQAIALDPGFSLAHARLALSLAYTVPDEDRLERARREAELALSILPGLSEARVALGLYYSDIGQPEEALRQLQAAETESPNTALATHELGRLQRTLGEFDLGLNTLERAARLDPRNPLVQRSLAWSYIHAHRYEDALRANAIREAVAPLSGEHDLAWIHLLKGETRDIDSVISRLLDALPAGNHGVAQAYPVAVISRLLTPLHEEALGSRELALVYWDSVRIGYEPRSPTWTQKAYLALAYVGLGEKEAAIRMAEDLVSLDGASQEGVVGNRFYLAPSARVLLARILAHFDEHDRAIDILEEELPAPSWLSVPILEIDPIWDPLRDHPRFQALLEEWAEDVGD